MHFTGTGNISAGSTDGADNPFVHRARFCGVFAPVGIFKMPSATLSRENHGRRTPFYISTGRASRNEQPPHQNVFGFSVDAVFVHITTNYTPSGGIQTKRMTLKVQDFKGHPHQVLPCGIEPQPSEPESEILSIKLREHFVCFAPATGIIPAEGLQI